MERKDISRVRWQARLGTAFVGADALQFQHKSPISMLMIASHSISRLKKNLYISNIDIPPSPKGNDIPEK